MTTKIFKCPVCGHEWHKGASGTIPLCDGFEESGGKRSLHPPRWTAEVSGKRSPLTGPYWR